MAVLDLENLGRYTDVVRLRAGAELTLRFVEPRDSGLLQRYFCTLSGASRYNRLMGAAAELPQTQLESFIHPGAGGSYSVVATIAIDGVETVVGEVRYAYQPDTASLEFGVSVDDNWHGNGIGSALLFNLECRAAAFGAAWLVGDTLRSNGAMLGLARKVGFSFAPTPGDWKQVRLEKHIDVAPRDIPCASWRLLANAQAHHAAAQ